MDHYTLQERLNQLGVEIPQSTLQRWASEGLIPQPKTFYKKKKGVGRPKKKPTNEQQPLPSPGRFKDWPEQTVEAAAAVWLMRNYSLPSDIHLLPSYAAIAKGKRRVTNETVQRVQKQGSYIDTLLQTDCKQAAAFFRTFLWKDKTPSRQDLKESIYMLRLHESTIHPLVPLYLLATGKARNKVPLKNSVDLEYAWVIERNGKTRYKGGFVHESSSTVGVITLKVTHLNPTENGYSLAYGYPNLSVFGTLGGFYDIFTMTEREELMEDFKTLKVPDYQPRSTLNLEETPSPEDVDTPFDDEEFEDFL